MTNKPQRMCIVCRTHEEKRQLIRVVRSPNGMVTVDLTGKANGRGAYICMNKDCFAKSKKTNALGRALKCDIPAEIYETLETTYNGNG